MGQQEGPAGVASSPACMISITLYRCEVPADQVGPRSASAAQLHVSVDCFAFDFRPPQYQLTPSPTLPASACPCLVAAAWTRAWCLTPQTWPRT